MGTMARKEGVQGTKKKKNPTKEKNKPKNTKPHHHHKTKNPNLSGIDPDKPCVFRAGSKQSFSLKPARDMVLT